MLIFYQPPCTIPVTDSALSEDLPSWQRTAIHRMQKDHLPLPHVFVDESLKNANDVR